MKAEITFTHDEIGELAKKHIREKAASMGMIHMEFEQVSGYPHNSFKVVCRDDAERAAEEKRKADYAEWSKKWEAEQAAKKAAEAKAPEVSESILADDAVDPAATIDHYAEQPGQDLAGIGSDEWNHRQVAMIAH